MVNWSTQATKRAEKIDFTTTKHVDVNASQNTALKDGDGMEILRCADASLYSDFIIFMINSLLWSFCKIIMNEGVIGI